MIDNGGGSIVNIASIAATRACSGASYAAAKAGMLGYTHQVAPELASRGRARQLRVARLHAHADEHR